MLSRRTGIKLCGVSLVVIGVVLNAMLYLSLVGESSYNVFKVSSHARTVDDFYSGVTSDIKGWKYMPSDREAEIEKEIEVRLLAASDRKV